MRENNCLTFLKDDLNSLYSSLGKDRYLKDDLMYMMNCQSKCATSCRNT